MKLCVRVCLSLQCLEFAVWLGTFHWNDIPSACYAYFGVSATLFVCVCVCVCEWDATGTKSSQCCSAVYLLRHPIASHTFCLPPSIRIHLSLSLSPSVSSLLFSLWVGFLPLEWSLCICGCSAPLSLYFTHSLGLMYCLYAASCCSMLKRLLNFVSLRTIPLYCRRVFGCIYIKIEKSWENLATSVIATYLKRADIIVRLSFLCALWHFMICVHVCVHLFYPCCSPPIYFIWPVSLFLTLSPALSPFFPLHLLAAHQILPHCLRARVTVYTLLSVCLCECVCVSLRPFDESPPFSKLWGLPLKETLDVREAIWRWCLLVMCSVGLCMVCHAL